MKNIVIITVLFVMSINFGYSQFRPFPQNVNYPNGYKTSIISTTVMQNAYNRWKNLFLISSNGLYRVAEDDTTVTISEGMGLGMLLTAYFGEKVYFDRLLEFYKSKRTPEAYNLMAWRVTRDGIIDPGSATDGDLDVAFALLVAYCQWGGNYLDEAKSIISILKDHYFVSCGNVYTMKPGGQFGGCGLTDISYYNPALFRMFAKITKDTFWDTVAHDYYTLLQNSANSNTGLVPDWQSYDGIPGGDPNSGRTDYYRYDACRTPWRMSLDYIWNGDTTARYWCTKISNFANSIGANNIVDGYNLNGTPRGQYNNSAFVGGFAVGAMSNTQAIVNNFTQRLLSLENGGYDNSYFNLSLRCLYMLALTGNFWKPEISDDYLGQIPPGKAAIIFADSIISRSDVHGRLVISPDGKELFWNRVNFATYETRIMHVTKNDENWSNTEIPAFAISGITANPVFSPDGKKLFFEYRDSVNSSWSIKYVEKTDSGWSEAKSDGFLLKGSSSFTSSGKVYFTDYMANKPWESGIYSADYSDTGLSNIQPLNSTINSSYIDYTPFISPDDKYLLFSSSRPSMNEEMYIYISFRNTNGTWSTPEKISNAINFSAKARYPSISPDGKYLFFCGDDGNIYWVSIRAITQLNPTSVYESKSLPANFILYQNYPNPFNPTTTITFSVGTYSYTSLRIYDILGREVATLVNEKLPTGNHTIKWNAAGFPSGVYFYRLQARQIRQQTGGQASGEQSGSYTETKKLILIK